MKNNSKQKFSHKQKIYSEQVRLLYEPFMVSVAATLVAAILLLAAQWTVIEQDVLLGWMLALTIITILRALLFYFYKFKKPDIHESKFWGNMFLLGVFAAGTTWGIGAVLLFPDNNVAYQLVVITVLMAVCSGAVTSISVMRGALVLFIVPALLPVIPLFLLDENALSNIIAAMVVLGGGFYLKGSSTIYSNTRENIHLRLVAEESEQAQIKVEQLLLVKTAQLQSVISSAPLVLWTTDSDGVFTLSDGRGLKQINLKPNQVVGQSIFELYADYPDVIDAARRVLLGESVTQENKVGEYWYESHYIPDFNSQGEVQGSLGVAVDITERKNAAIELLAAKDEAERANKAKSTFLSNMSHELRTPLNAITGFTELLQLTCTDDSQQQYTDRVLKSSEHLLELINDILDISRIESGKETIFMESCSLNSILDECLTLIKSSATKAGIRVINNVNEEANYNIHADFTRFKQVILNLLSNAIKYNNDNGSVTVSCDVLDNKYLRIDVSDTGNGLTQEEQEKVFQPFERLENHTQIQGTGIGLVISKNLIEKMDGLIGVESQIGQGSTFWVKIKLEN